MGAVDGYRWEYDIPLLTNRYMLWDFAKLFVATFILTNTILLIATGFEYESILPLSLLGEAIFIGLFILTSIFLGNHVRSVFIIDKNGVGSKVSRRMSDLNKVTIVLGLLAGNPGVAGAGFLASSQGEAFHGWGVIEKVTVDRKRMVISFHNSWRTMQRVYCYPDNFDEVLGFVEAALPGRVVYGSRISGF